MLQHIFNSRTELPILILIWYFCTAFASIETKRFISTGGNVIEFTFLSFAFALPLWAIYEIHKNSRRKEIITIKDIDMEIDEESLLSRQVTKNGWPVRLRMVVKQDFAVAVLQACHIHFTNISIGLVDVKFAYMVQTIEPLLTLIFLHAIMNTRPYIFHVVSLLPVPVGVYLATVKFNHKKTTTVPTSQDVHSTDNLTLALIPAFISVATISARNVFFKGNGSKEKLVSVPDTILESSSSYWRIASIAAIMFLPAYMYSYLTSNCIFLSFDFRSQEYLLLLRGVLLHVIYNTLSFVTLAKMESVTHSVFNVIKRIITVMISMAYFNADWIPVQIFGIILANIGIACYGYTSFVRPISYLKESSHQSGDIKQMCIVIAFALLYLSVMIKLI